MMNYNKFMEAMQHPDIKQAYNLFRKKISRFDLIDMYALSGFNGIADCDVYIKYKDCASSNIIRVFNYQDGKYSIENFQN